ncbi:MAG TPA: lysophospholipid acyltransferase family protein [Marmoricola sp.]|nr:lysophospholipid acyltransferase family protein [Marmoricola sp.]
MGDAEIIPLGTRGTPGRGTGRTKPSSTSRGLAPKNSAAKPAAVNAPRAAKATKAATATKPAKAAPPASPPKLTDPKPAAPAVEAQSPKSEVKGIPASDWVAATVGAAQEMWGPTWERSLAQFLAYLRRRLSGEYVVDEFGFDQEFTEAFLLTILRPIAEKWFRIEVRGTDNIPATGGALVVSNHSGTIPIDAAMTATMVHRESGRFLRSLGADLVFKLPIVSELARVAGATLACNEDAERMLRNGELVGVWPEGFKGIGKPFSDRYKLQRFGRGGFVSAAMRTGVPIIPVSVVGAEEIYPLVGNVPALARMLGIPYVPITPFFPWLGPLGLVPLPSKWLIEFGEPIRTDAYEPGAAEDPMLVFNVTDQVRETIQQTLYNLLLERPRAFG